MFDPHKTPSFFWDDERRRRRSYRANSFSSSEEVEHQPVIGGTTAAPLTPPSSPSFLFRNAVLLHVSPDSVADNAGLYDDNCGGEDR